jgi:hypothetical protein
MAKGQKDSVDYLAVLAGDKEERHEVEWGLSLLGIPVLQSNKMNHDGQQNEANNKKRQCKKGVASLASLITKICLTAGATEDHSTSPKVKRSLPVAPLESIGKYINLNEAGLARASESSTDASRGK